VVEDGIDGHGAAEGLRYLVAMKARAVAQRKLRDELGTNAQAPSRAVGDRSRVGLAVEPNTNEPNVVCGSGRFGQRPIRLMKWPG